MTVGERIRQKRIELGYSVEEIAAKLKKNRATIYRYESNEIENLPITVLEPLAKVLETSPAYLMGWIENDLDDGIVDYYYDTLTKAIDILAKDGYIDKPSGNGYEIFDKNGKYIFYVNDDDLVRAYERIRFKNIEPDSSSLIDYILKEEYTDAFTAAAHKVGHEGPLTDEEKKRVEMALKIALDKNNK